MDLQSLKNKNKFWYIVPIFLMIILQRFTGYIPAGIGAMVAFSFLRLIWRNDDTASSKKHFLSASSVILGIILSVGISLLFESPLHQIINSNYQENISPANSGKTVTTVSVPVTPSSHSGLPVPVSNTSSTNSGSPASTAGVQSESSVVNDVKAGETSEHSFTEDKTERLTIGVRASGPVFLCLMDQKNFDSLDQNNDNTNCIAKSSTFENNPALTVNTISGNTYHLLIFNQTKTDIKYTFSVTQR